MRGINDLLLERSEIDTRGAHDHLNSTCFYSPSSSSFSLPSTRLLLHPLILLVLLLLNQLVPQRHQLLQLALSELLFWIAFQKAQLVLLLHSFRFLLLFLLSLARQERLKEEDGRRSAVRTLFSLGRQVRRGDLGPAAHHRLRISSPALAIVWPRGAESLPTGRRDWQQVVSAEVSRLRQN